MNPIEQVMLEEVEAPARLLDGHISHTPLIDFGDGIFLKPEMLQPRGSFKIRSVFHSVVTLDDEDRARGLSTVSAGNTAKALAHVARHFGVTARAVMPETAPETKKQAVRALGGEPVLMPVCDVFDYFKSHGWEAEPYAFIHPWIERQMQVGHGTMGLEVIADCPDVETVFIPVGGGGLMGGVAGALKALKPSLRVVAVEPEGYPAFHASRQAGRPMSVDCKTMCDGVAVPYMTEEAFPLLNALADEAVLISEDDVRAAIRTLVMKTHLVAEGSAALALCAAMKMPAEERGVSVCLLTGGAIDQATLAEILS